MHRIGQTKETYFVKILANDTIDEGMVRMQKAKLRKMSAVLHEDCEDEGGETGFTLEEVTKLIRIGEESDEEEDYDGVDGEERVVRGRGGSRVVVVSDGEDSAGEEEVVVDGDDEGADDEVVADGDQDAAEEVSVVDRDGNAEEPEALLMADGDGNEQTIEEMA